MTARFSGKLGKALALLRNDVKFSLRTLLKKRGFVDVAVATLALGIGANTAMFSVVKAVLLDPLPYPDPSRLVIIDESRLGHGSRTVSWLDFQDWKGQNRAFDQMAGYRTDHVGLTDVEDPALLQMAEVSSPFFEILGTQAAVGRTFSKSDDEAGAERTVVISDRLWRTRLNSDPEVLGRTLTLGGFRYSIIGILPPRFDFFDKPIDVYLPLGLRGNDPEWNQRGTHPDLFVLAKMRPGIDVAAARAEMSLVMRRLEQNYPQSNAGLFATVTGLYEYRFGTVRPVLLGLFAAVGCILLIACVNVANLILARGFARKRELAIRAALGADRKHLLQLVLSECAVLSLSGAAVGLLLASAALHALTKFGPRDVPQLHAAKIDFVVLLFTLCVAAVTGLLFGAVPAMQLSKVDLTQSLKEGGRGAGTGRRTHMFRSILLTAEIAIALMLVAASGLLGRSLLNAVKVNPGVQPDHLLAIDLFLPPTKYVQSQEKLVLVTEAVHRLRDIPRVRSASAAYCAPMVGVCVDSSFMLADHPVASVVDLPTAALNMVAPGYFETAKISLIEGRLFDDSDDHRSRPVAIVNQSFARRYWPGGSAIGKQIREGGAKGNQPYREIIGVVADVKQNGLDAEQRPEVYLPLTQFPFAPWDSLPTVTFLVRTETEPAIMGQSAKNAVQAFDKDLLITNIRPVTQDVAASIARRKFSTLLFGAFAVLGLVLGAVGTYGITAFNVNQRIREIGIRMALGATPRNIWQLIFRKTMTVIVIGIAIGAGATLVVSHWIGSLLFGVRATDPDTLTGAAIILAAVALLAAGIPLRRAMRVDPCSVLHYD